MRYRFGDTVRIYTLDSFKPFEKTIKDMPTTNCYVVHEDVADEITFSDFDDLIKDLRKDFTNFESRNFLEGIELDQVEECAECGDFDP